MSELLLDVSIEACGFRHHIRTALRNAGYHTIRDVVAVTNAQLLSVPGIGSSSVRAIRNAIYNLKAPMHAANADIIQWALDHEHLIRALMHGEAEIRVRPTI